jgi:hypothetical protein
LRRKSLSILTVALSLTLVSPSVYAGSQEPPIGPAPGPPKTPAEKEAPSTPKLSNPPGQKRTLEPPFDLSRESSAAKPSKPSKDAPDGTSDKGERSQPLKKRLERALPSPKDFTEPNQSGPIWKRLKPTDPESKSANRSGANSKSSPETSDERSAEKQPNPRQERKPTDSADFRRGQEPNTIPRVAEAKPAGVPSENRKQDSPKKSSDTPSPEAASSADRATARTGGSSPNLAIATRPGKEADRRTEVAASSAQTDRQLPRTEETPLPKTASHGPWMMIIGLLTAVVGWAGRKISSSEG